MSFACRSDDVRMSFACRSGVDEMRTTRERHANGASLAHVVRVSFASFAANKSFKKRRSMSFACRSHVVRMSFARRSHVVRMSFARRSDANRSA